MLDGLNLFGPILFSHSKRHLLPGQPLERCRQPRSAINYSTFVNSICGSVSRYQILLSVPASNITKRTVDFCHTGIYADSFIRAVLVCEHDGLLSRCLKRFS